MSSMICSVCRGTSFYEDNDGTFCCRNCGLQSQDYIPESNDIQDGILGGSMGKTEKISFITKKVTRRKRIKVPKSKGASLYDFLSSYQNCLMKLTNSMPYKPEGFVKYIRYIWMQYLMLWSDSSYSIMDCVSNQKYSEYDFLIYKPKKKRAKKDSNICEDNHPMIPTLPLLLGFLYVGCRQLRLPILPSDIIHWVNNGTLPYRHLWKGLPSASISSKWRQNIFNRRVLNFVITPSNILFNTNSLCYSLKIELAPLNSPLIVRYLIKSFALPPSVWLSYCKLFQVLKDYKVTSPGMDPYNQHYIENILVQLIMSCKMTKNWLNWKLITNSADNSFTLPPQNLYELSTVKRSELQNLLGYINSSMGYTSPAVACAPSSSSSSSVYSSSTTATATSRSSISVSASYEALKQSNFNSIIKNYLETNFNQHFDLTTSELDSQISSTDTNFGASNSHGNFYNYSNNVKTNAVFHTGYSTFGSTVIEDNYNKILEEENLQPYILYPFDKNAPGVYYLKLIALVERFAKFTLTKVGLLCNMLGDVEQDIYRHHDPTHTRTHFTATTNTTTNTTTTSSSSNNKRELVTSPEIDETLACMFESKKSKVIALKTKHDIMFPAIHDAGLKNIFEASFPRHSETGSDDDDYESDDVQSVENLDQKRNSRTTINEPVSEQIDALTVSEIYPVGQSIKFIGLRSEKLIDRELQLSMKNRAHNH